MLSLCHTWNEAKDNDSSTRLREVYPQQTCSLHLAWTTSGRVRLTRRAVAVLKDHRKRQLEERMRLAGLWQDQGLVFPNETGSLLNPSNLRNRSFKRIKARSGVREDLRFHDLRHTCATLLLSEGVNAKVVSEILGHASITITLNTYSHVLPDMQDSAADAMEAALGAAP
jgi:integrase